MRPWGHISAFKFTCRRAAQTVRPRTGLLRAGTGLLRRVRALPGRPGGSLVVTRVALVTAVAGARREVRQVAFGDRLAAHRTEGLRLGYSAVHHDKLHCPPPNEKQNTVSAASA